ncbi:locomotion-related protein Hikaru genki-like protein, partial [Dinothrombium tinctorium]
EDNNINQINRGTATKHDTIVKRVNCASPEVLVNGSPSPDILDTVSGQKGSTFSSIEEIQFVGIIGPLEQKRICKIKCINGVWVGPLCALQQEDSPPSIVYSVASGDIGVNDEGEIVLTKGTIAHFDCLYSRQNGDPEWSWTMAQRQYPSGWAVNEDERNWKFRVSIYYANELDSGEFKCITPKGHHNSIRVIVK